MIALLATRAGAALAALIAFGVLWTTWLIQHDRKIIEKHEVRVEKEAVKKDAKAQVARTAAAAKPDGLLSQRYCRDCGKSGAVQIMESGNGVEARPADKADSRGNRSQ